MHSHKDMDLDAIRQRIGSMSDDELRAYGEASAWMAAHSERAMWRVQLEEARAEWQRRQQSAQPGGETGDR
jgi:hypothetical protein